MTNATANIAIGRYVEPATGVYAIRAHVAAGFVSVAMALIFAFLPYNLGLLVAGLLGMMAGAQVELIDSRRAERSGS